MKILHTSDWHLGRTLHGEDLHEHQAAFHEFLIELVEREHVDAVVIAGDVYDRSIPPVDSVNLLSRTLSRLADLTTVILTPGNHDSAVRLGFLADALRPGIHILAATGGVDHPVSVMDEHGEVLFFGLPYLDPDIARYDLAGEGEEPLARSHLAVMTEAMDRVRAHLAVHDTPRSVVLAHTFVAGGEPSESERDLTVGGVDSVPGSVFTGVDYVALGHLHGCQNMSSLIPAERPAAWYSGSPLAFSFSEKNHQKAVLLVEMDASGTVEVQRVATPVPRRLVELTGTLAEILERASEHSEDWVQAIVQEPTRPAHMQQTLRAAYPHLLGTEFRSTVQRPQASALAVTPAMDPAAVIAEFYASLVGEAPDAQQREIIEEALTGARAATGERLRASGGASADRSVSA